MRLSMDPRYGVTCGLVALMLLAAPAVSAQQYGSSGLGLSGFIDSVVRYDDTLSVSYSPDGEILAVGLRTGVAIHNASSNDLIRWVETDDPVLRVVFSIDGEYLVAGLRSLGPADDSVIILERGLGWQMSQHESGGKDVTGVAISSDNTYIAIRNSNTGIIEFNFPAMDTTTSFDGIHTEHVNCLSYDKNGTFILSGGEDRRLVKWVRESGAKEQEWLFNSPLVDCAFDPIEERVAALSADGDLRIYSRGGGLLFTDTLFDAKRLQWSADGTRMYVLQTIGSPRILAYVPGSWELISTTAIGHAALDFSVHPAHQDIAVTSDTEHLVLYSNHFTPRHYGEAGIDTDGDMVPNDLDNDDDGDGILDKWDINCEGGGDCSLQPDPDWIRHVNIDIQETRLIISDTVHYDSETSSAIRNITSESISDPGSISEPEADRVSTALCDNVIEEDVFSAWRDRLEIEGTYLGSAIFDCYATSGLIGVSHIDYNTRIRMTWMTTFAITQNPLLPFNVSITGMIPTPSGSAAQIAPLTPIKLTVHKGDSAVSSTPEWRVDSGSITLLVVEKETLPPTFAEVFSNFIGSNILWLSLILLGSIGAVVIIIRRRNLIDFGLDDEEEVVLSTTGVGGIEDSTEKTWGEDEWQEGEGTFAEDERGWRAEDGTSAPKPTRGPPTSKRQRIAPLATKSADQLYSEDTRKKSSSEQSGAGKRTKLSDVGGIDAPSDWDYGWDGSYDDQQEAFGYDDHPVKEVQTKVRKVKFASDEEIEESSEFPEVFIPPEPSKPTKSQRKTKKKKRKAKRRKAKRKGSDDAGVASAEEEAIMDSALDKLTGVDQD